MNNDYDYYFLKRNFDIKVKDKIDRSEVVLLVKDYIEKLIEIELKKARFKDLKVKTANIRITYTISDINKNIHESYDSDNLENRANLDSFYNDVMYTQAENVIENVKVNGNVTFK